MKEKNITCFHFWITSNVATNKSNQPMHQTLQATIETLSTQLNLFPFQELRVTSPQTSQWLNDWNGQRKIICPREQGNSIYNLKGTLEITVWHSLIRICLFQSCWICIPQTWIILKMLYCFLECTFLFVKDREGAWRL